MQNQSRTCSINNFITDIIGYYDTPNYNNKGVNQYDNN